MLPKNTAVVWSSLSGYWWKNRYSSNKFRSMHWNTSCNKHTNANQYITSEDRLRIKYTSISRQQTVICHTHGTWYLPAAQLFHLTRTRSVPTSFYLRYIYIMTTHRSGTICQTMWHLHFVDSSKCICSQNHFLTVSWMLANPTQYRCNSVHCFGHTEKLWSTDWKIQGGENQSSSSKKVDWGGWDTHENGGLQNTL